MSILPIGTMDRRIVIERHTSTQDAFGGDVETWATLTTLWASRQDASDSERLSAAQVNAVQMSRFVVRSSTVTRGVTAKDRINHDGSVWDIQGIKETRHGRKRFLEITAVRQAD